MEQTSSSSYPNILVVDYVKKARVANTQLLMKSEQYLNVGYQKLLTFERPGGGFDWWGREAPLVWLSAYALHQFNDLAKVYPIDRGVIDRTQAWLLKQQEADGCWSKIGATHSESIERMGDPKLLLTSYVTWSLVESGYRGVEVEKAIKYIRANVKNAGDNAYILALAANALAAWDAKDDTTIETIKKLDKLRKEMPEWKAVCFPAKAMSLSYARGDSITVETTALAILAMLKTGQFSNSINQGLTYLIKSKDGSGTWGSTQATILSLKAIVASASGPAQADTATFTVKLNGKEVAKGEVTKDNADVMQLFDLKDKTTLGQNDVEIEVKGETSLMYQVVGRYFEPWKDGEPAKPVLDVSVDYDRTKLSTTDTLKATATLKYNGDVPTYMVIVDLGIPPGFNVDAGDFAEMVGAKKIEKFTVTARQVTLYLGDVKPGDEMKFTYSLKPKYPIKAKTPATAAYEYYTPANRATAKPVELVVEGK
jgi:alkylhydroperoxidase/carboxymuconolactone decarboxylase family protein YurZ